MKRGVEMDRKLFDNAALKRLIIPLVIEQFLAVFMGMVDMIMVSSCGEAAISGVNLADSINILLINILAALATGGAVVASQYLGKQEPENASRSAKQLIYSSLIFALVLAAGAMLFCKPILSFIFGSVDPEVMGNASTYFFITAISYPFLALYNSGASLFRAMGDSKISMKVSMITNTENIIGNYIMIFPLQMGVAGAAISTLVSRITGAIIMLILLKKEENPIHIKNYLHFEWSNSLVSKILSVGLPSGLENGIFQLGKILVQSLVSTFGLSAIAANSVGSTMASVCTIPAAAIGLSLVTVVGQCMGAGKPEQASYYMKKLTGIAYICIFVAATLTYLSLPFIFNLYQLSPETMTIARELAVSFCIACVIFWPASFTFPNGLRAANDARYTMVVSVLSMWIFRVGSAYVFAQYLNMGVMGVWLAMYLDWIVRLTFFIIRFKSGKWQRRKLV